MDIGKRTLLVQQTPSQDPAADLRDVYLALQGLATELAITPGIATLPASVAISRGQAVNIFNGVLRLADAASSKPAIGVCIAGASAGQKAIIVLGMGYTGNLTGLTANSSVYLGNAGALLFAKPGAGFIQCLGYSLSTTEMWVNIGAP